MIKQEAMHFYYDKNNVRLQMEFVRNGNPVFSQISEDSKEFDNKYSDLAIESIKKYSESEEGSQYEELNLNKSLLYALNDSQILKKKLKTASNQKNYINLNAAKLNTKVGTQKQAFGLKRCIIKFN